MIDWPALERLGAHPDAYNVTPGLLPFVQRDSCEPGVVFVGLKVADDPATDLQQWLARVRGLVALSVLSSEMKR